MPHLDPLLQVIQDINNKNHHLNKLDTIAISQQIIFHLLKDFNHKTISNTKTKDQALTLTS